MIRDKGTKGDRRGVSKWRNESGQDRNTTGGAGGAGTGGGAARCAVAGAVADA